jgi:23S rRNA (cytosine1962-C5)-methyltransferase
VKKLKRHLLKRAVCDGLEQGHPWVFRDKVGDDRALKDGDWLQLVDPDGSMVATGIYQAEGGVGIRVLRLGHRPVSLAWLKVRLQEAMDRRRELAAETEAYRVLNGESDGFPGIVLDVYAGVGVLQTYTPGVDALGRYLAGTVCRALGLKALLWKSPSKRVGGGTFNRLLRGQRPFVVKFHEGPLHLAADLFSGQKSGTYLDLRGLRRFLLQQDLRGRRVLNLFAYTGMSGLACALAGAREVVNVDQAQPSLDFGRRYHKHPAMTWVAADIFEWVQGVPDRSYDLIVVDPPSMASNKAQVARALQVYHRLYSTLLSKLRPGGTVVACCCTSRISAEDFEQKVGFALRPLRRIAVLPMEIDHQPGFPEADYLKVMAFRQETSVKSGPAEKRRPGAGRAFPSAKPDKGRLSGSPAAKAASAAKSARGRPSGKTSKPSRKRR